MAYPDLEKLIGLMAGTEDPEHPDNVELVAQLGDPESNANMVRDHIQMQTEVLLAEPPGDMALDPHHSLAEGVTLTRRHIDRAMGQQVARRAKPYEVAAVVEALRMPPEALRTKAARDAAVQAGLENIRRQHPDSTLTHAEHFDATVSEWTTAYVRHVDMLLRGK